MKGVDFMGRLNVLSFNCLLKIDIFGAQEDIIWSKGGARRKVRGS